jgi:hypothetical protein
MSHRLSALCVLVAALLLLVASKPASALNDAQVKCQATIGKESGKFLKAYLKERAKYSDKQLKNGQGDLIKRGAKLDKAKSKLLAGLDKKCGPPVFGGFVSANMNFLGFPGKCPDPDPTNGFLIGDLQDCVFDTHKAQADQLFDLEFGSNGTDGHAPFVDQDLGKCQKEIFKNGQKFVATIQKEISKCRDGLIKGKLSGFLNVKCGDNPIETKPGEKIAKARSKLIAKISDKCSDAQIQALDICDTKACIPPSSNAGMPCHVDSECPGGSCASGPVTTAPAAAECIADSHRTATDDADNSGLATPFSADVIDIEYAQAAACGDNIVNDPLAGGVTDTHLGPAPEECDGVDDAACPGQCGDPTSNFACLCLDIPRERAIEHENADLDNGWTGQSHDSGIVGDGGYVVDLYECDGPGGSVPVCTVGPSCTGGTHIPCSNNAACGANGPCRKRATATGPHCNENVQQTCSGDGDCTNSSEDFCRKTPHGPPLPLSSGGVAVCVVNVFSEDVTGTTNLDTGAHAVRIRQRSITHIGSGTLNQPCPTCGGFCNVPLPTINGAPDIAGPGNRFLCQTDADCPATVTCNHDLVCAFGPNHDLPCRATPPFGNTTVLFGTPSVDCPPAPGQDISSGGLDILFNPATSGSVTVLPNSLCNAPGFGTKACIAGTNTGQTCTADVDCIGGGALSCRNQCFCPAVGGTAEQPNACLAACRGGGNDLVPCSVDSECPGGFCQQASCRLNVADTDSVQEGYCPGGPVSGLCSFSTWKGCTTNDGCRLLCVGGPSAGLQCLVNSDCASPGTCTGGCQACKHDNSETCVFKNRECFVNEGIVRTGSPGVPERVSASQFCISATSSAAVNNTAGIPGPGALTQPAATEVTGF